MSNEFDNEVAKVLAFDENDDGTLDYIVSFQRNALGQIVEVCLDYDGDNKADSKIIFEYDALGRIIKKYKDKNHDGIIDAIETYEYDSSGNRTTKYDDNADGIIDYVETIDNEGKTVVEDVRDLKQKISDAIKDIKTSIKFKI
ncbi:hypothetical protein IJ182_04335 [bacterium]|nr:hypothetical protein [bacterium]